MTNRAFVTYAVGEGGTGTITLFNQQSVTLNTVTGDYTLGCMFSLSEDMPLAGIWWYSPTGDTNLPTASVIYNAETESEVAGTLNASPAWSGVAGSGWIRCDYSGSGVTLSSDVNYIACIVHSGLLQATSNYWTTGTGASGITSGPLSAPNYSSSGNLQDSYVFSSSTPDFPTDSDGSNYWVDVEVGTPALPVNAQAVIVGPDGSFIDNLSVTTQLSYNYEKWQVENNLAVALREAAEDDTLGVVFL
jgi:hypothetical protein